MGRGHGQALKRALVTGASGFLGGRLAEMLVERGYQVRALVRQPCPRLQGLGVETVPGSLESRLSLLEACRDRDVVFHCAAKAGIWGDWQDYHRSNVEGTANLLEACRHHGVARFIFTSSPSVTFEAPGSAGGDESLAYPDNFLNHYSETKALAEKAVLQANGWGGMATTALRPHLIYGPGDPHLIPHILRAARQDRLVQVGDGSNQVDLTFVDNAAWAHILADENLEACAGRAYFISDDSPVALWPWINALLQHLRISPVRRNISLAVAFRLGGVIEWIFRTFRVPGEPPLTRFTAQQLALPHFYNLAAARRDFGYTVLVDPVTALQRTLEAL